MNAALLLADGTLFYGASVGAESAIFGELCFNTAMSGYQEILTDPSYNGQIVTFTFPHIGNVGCNPQDNESGKEMRGGVLDDDPAGESARSADGGSVPPMKERHLGASGLIIRESITSPSNFRSTQHLDAWLKERGIGGICGIDTRALTRHIRLNGAQNGVIVKLSAANAEAELEAAYKKLEQHPSLKGLDLAKDVATKVTHGWDEPRWSLDAGGILPPSALRAQALIEDGAPAGSSPSAPPSTSLHVVAVDYGVKQNILRCLISAGCRLTVVPAATSAEAILALKPDGVFLSNGPGDPAATGVYAVPVIQALLEKNMPIFGICLGHQMLAIAMGGTTEKMHQGHRGANHPVKDMQTGKVEITSQNHGFMVSENLPAEVEVTHRSLFDGTIQGIRHRSKPAFSVQGHPEASPGPHDSLYLFERFVHMMNGNSDVSSQFHYSRTA